MLYPVLFAATIFAIIPVMCIKQYIKSNNIFYLFITIASYGLLLASYVKIFRTGAEVSTIYVLLQILQILLVFFIGIFYFKESMSRNKLIGTCLGVISIYFLINNNDNDKDNKTSKTQALMTT